MNPIKIVDFRPQYAEDFRDINSEWIKQYFTMEEADYKSLNHPQNYYIDKGGYILVALLEDEVVGVVAMSKMTNDCFELSKMGVRPSAHGHGIGRLLCQSVIDKARQVGAQKLFLESNTILEPAINLYYKLGFKKIDITNPSPYSRSNIQMELFL